MEKVAFASDHAGYELKEVIKKYRSEEHTSELQSQR